MQVGPTLQEGSSGEAVEVLQRALQRAGFDPGPVDGEFGPMTAAAVRSFQAARGLVVDGIVGPQTWSALGEGEVTGPCANADTPATQLTQAAAEEAVLCLINEQRTANGVPTLNLNLKLQAAARLHAQDANVIRWWAGGGSKVHTNPVTGSTPKSRIREAGYCLGEVEPPTNENCYFGFFRGGVEFQGSTTPRAAVTIWMNSQGHRATLLDPVFRESGVAVVLGIAEKGTDADNADGGAIFVQTFGGCAVPG
jgi:uncharacterized protein YkwD